jgi:hypothetical protein
VLTGTYRELFAAIATSAAALTGLLFVVVTVRESRTANPLPVVAQQIRAAAALLSFTNALAVSLFGLVPGTNVGYPAVVVGVIGLLFGAAGMRSLLVSPTLQNQRRRQITLTIFLLLIFAFELVGGINLLNDPHYSGPVGLGLISNLLVASLIIGVARAWELVGGRDTGILSSLAVLIGHDPSSQLPADPRPPASTGTHGASEASRLDSDSEADKSQ